MRSWLETWRRIGLLFGLLMNGFVSASPSLAQSTAGVLTEAQVSCDAARLAGFLRRTTVSTGGASASTGLALTFSGTGDFAGIATRGGGGGVELALAFSSNGEETTLLRNPARPQLFAVSLTRNDLNSDLETTPSLRLVVNPTLDLQNPTESGLLTLDSGLGGRSFDAKPGRGLGALLTPCHDPLGARDVHLLRLLPKIVRGRQLGAPDGGGFEIAIYRGAAVDSYRLDVYPVASDGAPRGRIAGLVHVTYDPSGALAGGSLRLLPSCGAGASLDCSEGTGGIALVRPTAAGIPSPEILIVQTGGANEIALDWASLLDGTSWRRPL